MSAVNAYGRPDSRAVYGADKQGNRIVKSDKNLDMDDFLNLLTSQLSNQDVMNPATDTEFIAQMAQFSTLQAMKTLNELSMAQHGSSLVGKHVVVAHLDERGKLVEDKGVVSKIKYMGGIVTVTVNEKEYEISSIMEILTKEEFEKPPKTPDKDKDKDPNDPSIPKPDNGLPSYDQTPGTPEIDNKPIV